MLRSWHHGTRRFGYCSLGLLLSRNGIKKLHGLYKKEQLPGRKHGCRKAGSGYQGADGHPQVRDLRILTAVADFTATGRAQPVEGWACYHSEMVRFIHCGREHGIVGCAVGASYAALLAEQMFVSGCWLLVGVTLIRTNRTLVGAAALFHLRCIGPPGLPHTLAALEGIRSFPLRPPPISVRPASDPMRRDASGRRRLRFLKTLNLIALEHGHRHGHHRGRHRHSRL